MNDNEIIEASKAVQEASRFGTKTADLVDSTGRFLYRIIGEPIELSVGTLVTDPLTEFRKRRLADLQSRTEELLSARNSEKNRTVPPKTAVPLLENASLETEPEVFELWARLLASAIDGDEPEIDRRHVAILSEFSAKTVEAATKLWELAQNRDGSELRQVRLNLNDLAKFEIDEEQVEHLKSMGLLKNPRETSPGAEAYNDEGDFIEVNLDFEVIEHGYVSFTVFGARLMKRLNNF